MANDTSRGGSGQHMVLAIVLGMGIVLLMSDAVTRSVISSGPMKFGEHAQHAESCGAELRSLQALHRQVRSVAEMFKNIPLDPAGAAVDNAMAPPARRRLREQHEHAHGHRPPPHASCMQQVTAMHATILTWLGMIQLEVSSLQRSGAACQTAAEMLEADTSMVSVNTAAVLGTPVRLGGQAQAMVVPKNDEFVGSAIVQNKAPFGGYTLDKMLTYIKPGSVVLDVGANLGTYSIWFAKAVGLEGTVYSFEPQPYIYQVLCSNIVINGHRNVRTINAAASFKAGTTSMASTLPDGTTGGRAYNSTTLDESVNYGGRRLGLGGEPVPMITIDSLNLTGISFIKMDAQGSEPLVVWGARETIKRCQPVINFEAQGYFNVTEEMRIGMDIPDPVMNFTIDGFLTEIGYRYAVTVEEDQFWVPQGYPEGL